MRIRYILDSIFKNLLEWMYFLIVVIIIFNMFTDFTQKIGVVEGALTLSDIRYYGFLSVMFAINNMISRRFFGIEFLRTKI